MPQDPAFDNGKPPINTDGSVPADNPIPENSFYTRGTAIHKVLFTITRGIIYDVEHGDRTDDENKCAESRIGYGWKNVRVI